MYAQDSGMYRGTAHHCPWNFSFTSVHHRSCVSEGFFFGRVSRRGGVVVCEVQVGSPFPSSTPPPSALVERRSPRGGRQPGV